MSEAKLTIKNGYCYLLLTANDILQYLAFEKKPFSYISYGDGVEVRDGDNRHLFSVQVKSKSDWNLMNRALGAANGRNW